MKRRRCRREKLSPVLSALIARTFSEENSAAALQYLSAFATEVDNESAASVIQGDGLTKLCKELGSDVCARDLALVARSVPRSRSTPECISVSELCFAISKAAAPVDLHERRKTFRKIACVDESIPLINYYKNNLFATLLGCANHYDVQDEWKRFLDCISSPLPMSLRVHRSEDVLQFIANDFLLNDPVLSAVVQPISFLPSSVGLYGCSHAAYHAEPRVEYICRTLHAASAVSFQEAVSALPVLVADICPHHAVLDMCAAPGSKSLQALDAMLQNGWATRDASEGVMIVNEKDRAKATQILPSRLKRFHAPNVICTRCDATQWPRIFYASSVTGAEVVEKSFDRIICDVPCSGDGTIRKEQGVAGSWNSSYVQSLFVTQKALLQRGLNLLKKDGVLVYSTCSMNPKEDEEVVCSALEFFGDAVELIDVNAILKERGANLHSAGGLFLPSVDSLNTPTLPSTYDARKVLRVLPHRDNTGGFFLAAFRKRLFSGFPLSAALHKKLNNWTKGKLWTPVCRGDEVWCGIAKFYKFDPDCTDIFQYFDADGQERGTDRRPMGCGLVPVYNLNPNDNSSQRIVLLTFATAQMLFETYPYKGPGVEIVSVGVRAFEPYYAGFLVDADCRWRVVVESASYLAPNINARKIILDYRSQSKLLRELLSNGFVWLQDYWRVILQQEFTGASINTPPSLVSACGRLSEILASIEHVEPAADELHHMFMKDVLVGGVLIGVVDSEKPWRKENPWWLSALLSHSKLELLVGAALRTFGLLAFFNVDSDIKASPANISCKE